MNRLFVVNANGLAAANALFEGLGRGPNTFSVALKGAGTSPGAATFYAANDGSVDQAFLDQVDTLQEVLALGITLDLSTSSITVLDILDTDTQDPWTALANRPAGPLEAF